MNSIKIVAVGDGSIGKTCLLVTYTTGKFPEEYVPTVYENYSGVINIDNETIRLEIWDTSGQEDYRNLRPVSYPHTDIFLVCFSLISPTSLDNINRVWIPEIKQHCPNIPFILVGLKSDLRDNFDSHTDEFDETDFEPIKTEKAEEVKHDIGASDYIECSSCLKKNIKEVFEIATRTVMKSRQEQKRRTCQLI